MLARKVKVLLALLLAVFAERLPSVACQCAADDDFVDEGYTMAVGEKVRFVQQVDRFHHRSKLSVALCSTNFCSGVIVDLDEVSSGALQISVSATTSDFPFNWVEVSTGEAKTQIALAIADIFKARNYTFIMHRTSNASFEFWLESDPTAKKVVPTSPDQNKIMWDVSSTRRHLYTEPEAVRGDRLLAEGQILSFKVESSSEFLRFFIELCGPSTCEEAQIRTTEKEAERRLSYWIESYPVSSTYGGDTISEGSVPSPDPQACGGRFYTTFLIQRRKGFVDIWPEDARSSNITFATNHDSLRITGIGCTFSWSSGPNSVSTASNPETLRQHL